MWRNNKTRKLLSYASLESKRMLAGNVNANFQGDHIFLRGDQADNQIRIFDDDTGKIRIQGLNGTTVNNRGSVIVDNSSAVNGNLRIGSEFSGGLRAHMGPGNDAINVESVRFRGLSIIYGGTGDDFVNVSNVDFLDGSVVQTFDGNDRVTIQGIQVSGSLRAITLEGDDTLTIENSSLLGPMVVATGNGNDQLVLDTNEHLGTSQFALTQDGDDTIEVTNPRVGASGLGIFAGAGDDNVTGEISSGLAEGPIIIAGQADTDTSEIEIGSNYTNQVSLRGFEFTNEVVFQNAQRVDYGFATFLKPDDSFFVADFVEFQQTTRISSIEWLGSYEFSTAPTSGDRFVIEIYEGGTVEDDNIGEYQAPVGTPVATFNVGDNANRTDTGETWSNFGPERKIYSFSADVDFRMDPNVQYWISIYSAPTADQGADFNNDYYTLVEDVSLPDPYNGAANVRWPNFPNWYPNTSGKTHFTLRS